MKYYYMAYLFKHRMPLFLGAFMSCFAVSAQDANDRAQIKSGYDFESIRKQNRLTRTLQAEKEIRVAKYLKSHRFQKRSYAIGDVQFYIADVRKDGTPVIINTKNLGSSEVIKTNRLYNGGSMGLNIQGQSLIVGVWDGGLVRTSHELLTGKATQIDGATTLSNHATHVTGTMVGADISARRDARGIAFSATARTYFWDDDVNEYSTFADAGYLVSNHSYGRQNVAEPIWSFGAYDGEARNLDEVLKTRPNYLQCWAGGNEQTSNNNFANKAGYDIMTGTSVSKNILTVGAVNSNGEMSDFSNWGPTDDGRIKPEVCAKGVAVTSSYSTTDNTYNTGDGTSYASPAVAASALLLQQYYHNKTSAYMESAGVKGLILHTATDLGLAGPDYKFGWGLVNAELGARVIGHSNADFGTQNSEAKIAKITTNPAVGGDVTYTVRANGTEKLMVSVSWIDDGGPEQVEGDGIDPTTSRLVYNFDIKVKDLTTNIEYFPWSGPGMANRTQVSTRTGLNNVDNYKRVDIDAPVAGREYEITITKRTGSPVATRNYTLIATGLQNSAPTTTTWNGTTWSNGTPDFSIHAVIASSTAPTSFTCNNLTINNGVELTSTGITVNIHGNITNNGNGIAGNGTIVIGNNSSIVANGVTLQGTLNLVTGTLTTSNLLSMAPNANIIGTYANVNGNVTLQQNIIAQRGWRVLANPFTGTQTLSTVATNNGITIGTTPGPTGITDARAFSNANNTWSNLTSTVASNQAFALFIRGLASEVTGLNYNGGGPSAFKLKLTGALNTASTINITPDNGSGNFLLVGNPFAAPVNSIALTGNTASNYSLYQITEGGNETAKRTRAGSWIAQGAQSSATATIPVLGVLAYQPANTNMFGIATSAINTGGTLATNLFATGSNKGFAQLGIEVQQNGKLLDKIFARINTASTQLGNDADDFGKFKNDVVNIYAITKDEKRLSIDSRNELKENIPVGITATAGTYELLVAENSLPENTVAILKDNFLNTETELKANVKYTVEVNNNAASQGENRFEIVFTSKSIASSITENIATQQGFSVKILGNNAQGSVQIKLQNATNNKATLLVRDIHGRTINSKQIVNGTSFVELPTSKGLYIIEINDGVNKVIEKIIR